MIARMSAAIAAGPVGRSAATLRQGPLGRLAASRFFDWLIPSALVIVIVVGSAWTVFVGN
jgi:hypothetical protein